MNVFIVFLLCGIVGSALGYYVQREAPYNIDPNNQFSAEISSNILQEPSQRLFWDKFGNSVQGSNQVGGTGWWASLTNKFPFLANMFGRMEVPTQYGVPTQFDVSTQQYTASRNYQPQLYQSPPYYQQQHPRFTQRFVPSGRDVTLTDDAVIVTPPHVPILPQPAPAPVPAPVPQPEPTPGGYQYNKPQYRLELPHK